MNITGFVVGIDDLGADDLYDITIGPFSEQAGYAFVRPQERIMGTSIEMTDTQQGKLTVTAKDKKGAATTFAVSTSDSTVATVVTDPKDPTKITVIGGLPGTCDLNLGPSKMPVKVLPGPAVTFDVTVDSVEEQP